MSHIFKGMSDAELDRINHLIRRDAKSDLEIAAEAERALGVAIGPTEPAKAQCVKRWRDGAEFTRWLKQWEMRSVELERHLNEVRTKYEVVSNLVKNDDASGIEGVSQVILARLLTQAVEANDEELKAASGSNGWVANAVKLAVAAQENRWRKKADDLKAELTRMVEHPARADGKTDAAALVGRVDEIMGLK
jgi:hypothetical protein